MAITATALADMNFGLRFASKRYRRFSSLDISREIAFLFQVLADERSEDAHAIEEAAAVEGLSGGNPTIDDETAGTAFSLGHEDPVSAKSATFRVQRAENTLRRMVAQLESLADREQIRTTLHHVGSDLLP